MRHRKGYRKLSKATDQRKALLISLATAVIKNGKIVTSKQRAKEARKVIEKVVALSKRGGLANLRKAKSILPDRSTLEFFKSAPTRFADKAGGCTRITHVGLRRGDAAEKVVLELI